MKLVLPPRVSPREFDAALKAFAAVVGQGWVMSSDEDRTAYADLYAPGSEEQWPVSAAVSPATTEEVQAVLQVANQHRIPLWPVSRGKNLGYGQAAPRMAGTVVLDLGRMNKIHEINEELGYAVIEPGVGFFDLYEELQRRGSKLWMSVPGNGWGSVLGNALDHGIGYTPYGIHARNLCGLEVVLPSGDVVHTGMGGMADNKAAHVFPLSFGPDWTQMFTQSNLGVVTRAGMWLMPAPETSLQLSMQIPNVEDIGWVVDTISPMKVSGLLEQNVFVPSFLAHLVPLGTRKDFWDKPSAMPDWRIQEILKQHKLGFWTVDIRFYGHEDVNKAKAAIVKAAFKRHTNVEFIETWWRKGDPYNQFDLSMGVPTAAPLQMGAWVGGRSAHLGFSPVVPATSAHVLGQLKRSKAIITEADIDFYGSFTLGGRFCTNINMLMFDRNNEAQVAKMKGLFNTLIHETAKAGYGEYRTHLGWMDAVSDTYDHNDHAQRKLNETVKNALDPKGILAPGKQGVWPAAYADMRSEGRA